MDDSRIIDLYLARDESALAETQSKYGSGIRGLVGRVLRNDADAEECVSDTWLAVWNSIPPKEPREHFFCYIAGIARKKAIDKFRTLTREKRGGIPVELGDELAQCLPSPVSTEDEMMAKELGKAISTYLRTLPDEKRNLFVCRYWGMESVERLAARSGMGKNNVKTTLYRIRQDLKKYLEKEGYEV